MAMNKTERIKQFLVSMIEQGEVPPDGKLPSEKELCERFGVSRVPVQSALKELTDSQMIYRIKGSGSFVCQMNRRTRTPHSDNIIPFVINESVVSARFLETIKGAENFLKSVNHYLTVHYTGDTLESERETLISIVNSGIGTLLILPDVERTGNEAFYNQLIQQGLHLIFVDNLPQNISANLIASDNINGGYLATKHLLDKGYTRIALINGHRLSSSSTIQRIEGYSLALAEVGIPIKKEYLICIDDVMQEHAITDFTQAVDVALSFKNISEPPEAIFCLNDTMALIAYHSLRRIGKAVPQDIALIGFDNLPETATLEISTIEQPFYRLGYRAAQLGFQCKNGDNGNEKTQVLLPVELLARKSTQK